MRGVMCWEITDGRLMFRTHKNLQLNNRKTHTIKTQARELAKHFPGGDKKMSNKEHRRCAVARLTRETETEARVAVAVGSRWWGLLCASPNSQFTTVVGIVCGGQ